MLTSGPQATAEMSSVAMGEAMAAPHAAVAELAARNLLLQQVACSKSNEWFGKATMAVMASRFHLKTCSGGWKEQAAISLMAAVSPREQWHDPELSESASVDAGIAAGALVAAALV